MNKHKKDNYWDLLKSLRDERKEKIEEERIKRLKNKPKNINSFNNMSVLPVNNNLVTFNMNNAGTTPGFGFEEKKKEDNDDDFDKYM